MGAVAAEKSHTDNIPVDDDLGEHPAYVMVKGGVTKNMGNYESINVQVSIGMPCKANFDAVQEMYLKVSDKVDELMEREVDLAKNGSGEVA